MTAVCMLLSQKRIPNIASQCRLAHISVKRHCSCSTAGFEAARLQPCCAYVSYGQISILNTRDVTP